MSAECPAKRCPNDPPGRGHHWIIEAPAGSTSKGVCKHCNAVKNFKNSGEQRWYEYIATNPYYDLERILQGREKRAR